MPWKPKVHRRDIEEYLSASRKKFVGYRVEDDLESMAGLPQPILEGRSILDKVRVGIRTVLCDISRRDAAYSIG